MSAAVTNIQIGSLDNVLFYNDTEIVRGMSQVAPATQTFILRNGLDIIILQPAGGTNIQLQDQTYLNDPFIFSTSSVLRIGSRTFTAIDQNDPDSAELNTARAIVIYNDLVTNVFKGCCECGECSCPIEYNYSNALGSGTWYFTSGLLLMSFISYNNQAFDDLLAALPDGSWITFIGQGDPTLFATFEISTYSGVSGYAAWTATLIAGTPSFDDGTIFCTILMPALGGGGSVQGLQDVITEDPILTTDNSIDAGGNSFEFVETNIFAVISETSGGNYSGIQSEPNFARLDAINSGADSATVVAQTVSGVTSAAIIALDSVVGGTSVLVDGTRVNVVTPNVYDGTNPTGMALVGINSTGDVEFAIVGVSDGDKGDITVSSSGTVWTIDNGVVSDAKVASGIDAAKISGGTVSNAEFDYLNGVTSSIQTQLNAKANLFHNFIIYGNTIASLSTRYFAISGGTGSGTESAVELKVIVAFTATGIGVRTSTAQSGLGAITVTLRKNNADTALTFTIAAGSAAGYFSDVAHTVSFAAGDLISLACVNAAAATSANVFNGTLTGK